MDVHSPQIRSFNMSRIHSKNTKPELMVRKWLWSNDFRYKLHANDLPGKPDIIFRMKKSAIFIHGCFWHRHTCRFATIPASNKVFWTEKFLKNIQRDKQNIQLLEQSGWKILTLWECEIKAWSSDIELKIRSFLA